MVCIVCEWCVYGFRIAVVWCVRFVLRYMCSVSMCMVVVDNNISAIIIVTSLVVCMCAILRVVITNMMLRCCCFSISRAPSLSAPLGACAPLNAPSLS